KEDNDEGAAFLNYEQTIDGIPVFQSQVQVAINSAGQVMSVNEGLVIPSAIMNTTPRISESEGLAQAFLSTGRLAPPSFEVMQNRQERGGRSGYQNPLGETRENILSRLMIMRVGPRGGLAWHLYLDVRSHEWCDVLADAEPGA